MNKKTGATIRFLSAVVLFLAIAANAYASYVIPTGAVTTAKIAANAVTRPKLGALGQQISSSCGTYSTASASYVAVTNLSVTITTTGRPVMLMLQSDNTTSPCNIAASSNAVVTIAFFNGSGLMAPFSLDAGSTTISTPGSLSYMQALTAGTYTFYVKTEVGNSGTMGLNNCVLAAFEM